MASAAPQPNVEEPRTPKKCQDYSPPETPTECVFSPPESISTDITDDYGWDDTLVKSQKGSPEWNESSDVLQDSPDEAREVDGLKGDDVVDRKTASQDHTLKKAKAKRDSAFILRLKTSSLQSQESTDSVLSKRKQDHVISPVFDALSGNDESSLPPTLDGISRRFSHSGANGEKRFRQESVLFWTLDAPTRISDIAIEFSGIGSNFLRGRTVSDVTGARSPSKTVQASDQDSPASLRIPRIMISPPGAGESETLEANDIPPGENSVQSSVHRQITQQEQLPCIPPKVQGETEKSLSKIMPLEIHRHLLEDKKHCPAWTAEGRRCKNRRTVDVMQVVHSLRKLTMVQSSQVSQCVKDVVDIAVCSTHRRVAGKELGKWEEEFGRLSEVEDWKDPALTLGSRFSSLVHWVHTISGGENTSRQGAEAFPPVKLEATILREGSTKFSLIQDFKPYKTTAWKPCVNDALKKVLIEPLGINALQYEGYIYVYWQPGNFGHLKIGWTTDVDRRMKRWNSQCKKSMEVIFPQRSNPAHRSDLQAVQHVSRVEALVHTELNAYRRVEQNCPGCTKNHQEWFEISRDLAIEVIRKWVNWMRTSPYMEQSRDGKGQWVLKDKEMARLRELSRPLAIPAPTSTTTRRSSFLSISPSPGRSKTRQTRRKSM